MYITYLSSLTREVVSGGLLASDTRVEISITTVVSAQNRVLEATGIEQGKVDLAVLARFGDLGTATNGGNILIEDQGDNGPVKTDGRTNGA